MMFWPAHHPPLLDLDDVRHQLGLGMPHAAGSDTIAVADIVGTTGRARDFDSHFTPLEPALARRIRDIDAAHPEGLSEPIDVVRVGGAYFVTDGHKRVSLAKLSGREFIDARISEIPIDHATDARIPSTEHDDAMLARLTTWLRHGGRRAALRAA
jgi:hypothetical protein